MWEILKPILFNLIQQYGPVLFNIIIGLLGWSGVSRLSGEKIPKPSTTFSKVWSSVKSSPDAASGTKVELSLRESAKSFIDAGDTFSARKELDYLDDYVKSHPLQDVTPTTTTTTTSTTA